MSDLKDVIVREPTRQEIDTCSKWPTWSCAASEFDWEYTQQETCLIIKGRVTVWDTQKKDSVSFGAGDIVIFPSDLACIWQIHEDVEKYYDFD